MEVRIRLQKVGNKAKKHYNFRIVAIGRHFARQGRHLEELGHYDPAKKPATLSINHEKLDRWIAQGATLSETVASLIKQSKKQTAKAAAPAAAKAAPKTTKSK